MTYHEGLADVRQHSDLFEHLVAVAADPTKSARIIEQAREKIR
jgi:hypothetical protein